MKQKRKLLIIAAAAVITGGILFAADHIDAPAVKGTSSDISDMYVFQGQDNNNLVFVANVQGLLAPSATGAAKFDPNVMIEFNIDNNGDNIEDLVIQGVVENNMMKVYGPVKPSATGSKSKAEGSVTAQVAVTAYSAGSATIGTGGGLKVFAGPRDDPFFFDFTQYTKIIGGMATSFNSPGSDTFAGTNVMSFVVEVPKSMLNATNGSLNVWVETKKKL